MRCLLVFRLRSDFLTFPGMVLSSNHSGCPSLAGTHAARQGRVSLVSLCSEQGLCFSVSSLISVTLRIAGPFLRWFLSLPGACRRDAAGAPHRGVLEDVRHDVTSLATCSRRRLPAFSTGKGLFVWRYIKS